MHSYILSLFNQSDHDGIMIQSLYLQSLIIATQISFMDPHPSSGISFAPLARTRRQPLSLKKAALVCTTRQFNVFSFRLATLSTWLQCMRLQISCDPIDSSSTSTWTQKRQELVVVRHPPDYPHRHHSLSLSSVHHVISLTIPDQPLFLSS